MVPIVNHKQQLFESCNDQEILPLSILLKYLCLSKLADEIEKKYYSKDHFHYPVELMLKLLIIMRYRKLSFRKVTSSLSEEDIECLFTPEQMRNNNSLPSGKTLHHFVYYRLGTEGLKEVMTKLGEEMTRYLNLRHLSDAGLRLIIDSTPFEASRYSKYSPYNEHYKIHMDKGHIISGDGYPLFMIFSGGNENDAPHGRDLIDFVTEFNPKVGEVLADGGYDNYLMYSKVYGNLGVIPSINIRENAVISQDAAPEKMKKVVSRLWKRGGDVSQPIGKQLEFLCSLKPTAKENPDKYKILVGKYLRNHQLQRIEEVNKCLSNRGLCEEKHAQYKTILKFNVKGYRENSRELYSILDFISLQCMFLTYLQNNSQNTSFSRFI